MVWSICRSLYCTAALAPGPISGILALSWQSGPAQSPRRVLVSPPPPPQSLACKEPRTQYWGVDQQSGGFCGGVPTP
eukprot:5566023-Pyramimonas_sp.AAC.1